MDKKIFIKNKPLDVNDLNDTQNWAETGIKNTMKSMFTYGIVDGLNVTINSGLKLNINNGSAFDSNYDFINVTTNPTVTLTSADTTNPRYDKIVISYQSSVINNIDSNNIYGMGASYNYSQNKLDSFVIQVIKGTASSSPVAPSTPSGAIVLAQIYIAANATSISTSNITDLRNFIAIQSNINKPEIVKSSTAPSDTNVLWFDTNINKFKVYITNTWIIIDAKDADTLDGQHGSYYATATHNHDMAYAKIGDAYIKAESDGKYITKANNLSDLSDKSVARSNLGLGSAAVKADTYFSASTHNHDGNYVKGDYILIVSSTAPTGDAKIVWWDTTNNLIKRYVNTSWTPLNASDATTVSGKSIGTGANNILLLDSSGKVPIANIPSASGTSAGSMSSTDFNKLSGIENNANNYVHPTTHPPSIISQDANNRFVTDTEKSTWNAKASTAVATSSADGLMPKADKSKLDGIEVGAEKNDVISVNGKAGAVSLTYTDVNAASSSHNHDSLYASIAGDTFNGHIRMASQANTASSASFVIYFDTVDSSGVKTTNNYLRADTTDDLLYYKAGASNTIWHSGNDGSGSGLDADKVDGLQASQFLRSDSNDTVTGLLSINVASDNCIKFLGNGTSDLAWLGFYKNDGITRKGWIGYGNTANSGADMGVYSDSGSVILSPGSGMIKTQYGSIIEHDSVAARFGNMQYQTYLYMGNGGVNFYDQGTNFFYMYYDGHCAIQGGSAMIKWVVGTQKIQVRNTGDTAFIPIEASAFTVNSKRDTKTNINELEFNALDAIKNTMVYNYQLKEEFNIYGNTAETASEIIGYRDKSEVTTKIGLIWEEAPEILRQEETIDIYSMAGLLWKSIQQLSEEKDKEIVALRQEIDSLNNKLENLMQFVGFTS